ncbi:MAG: BamA/TamA family outer membrane protein [Bacteroidales bacterium]|jgi:outer membrane protein assembly factor BamA|nr:outer membrane protein assembly factor [Bacteroidales bacterium]MDD2617251.1 BamA/TamA family outer membrane protein [Bacteroidales bacterium]MDD4640310.1 BamA/TamA family outer membrane protein [Bacteroidales bacterium]NLB01943.1 BamA/TamA family outer membrane protein [Bacteroidales bacterium]
MKKKTILIALMVFALFAQSRAQDIIKSGYNLGALPAISYNSDLGFQYGVILNLFHYGDGSRYPAYDHSLYLEVSRYTKGTGVYRLYYDSDRLIRGVRSFIDLSYMTNRMQDFYGFNGFRSIYSTDSVAANSAFYKMDQNKFHLMADFQGDFLVDNLKWLLGYGLYNYSIAPVNREKLNKGKPIEEQIPDRPGLYQKYVEWGLISPEEQHGGMLNLFKAGFMYDSRNAKTNPSKGVFTEALLEVAPPLLNESPYVNYIVMHRQYQSLIENRLNAVLRIGVQGKIGNNAAPFYRKPQLISTFATRTVTTGLGGNSTLRGILQNRVVGDAFAMANVELRWKMINFRWFNQNFYIGTNYFWDAGYIIDPVDWADPSVLTANPDYFADKDGLHHSAGLGLKIAMNENFVLSADFGKAFNKQDGAGLGTYIGLNYLF